MNKKSPYQIIKHRHITEKAAVLQNLHNATSNQSSRRCENPKFVFIVDNHADKRQIADAIEEIYADRNVKVVSVNTINVKGKLRRVRGRLGRTNAFKKAIVTLGKGETLDNV